MRQTLRRIGERIADKSERNTLLQVLWAWKDAAELSLQLLSLHDRIEVKHSAAVAQVFRACLSLSPTASSSPLSNAVLQSRASLLSLSNHLLPNTTLLPRLTR